ncbi:MAG: hypothetical protein EBZ48_03620 [Proteobacteria bacterium]|nr:hypothetical protein [Pseudomonadota bacterium]
MARRSLLVLLCLLSLSAPPLARAEDEEQSNQESNSCAAPCPEGQVKSSFLDGARVSCVCMVAGPGMQDDTDVVYGGTGPEADAHT